MLNRKAKSVSNRKDYESSYLLYTEINGICGEEHFRAAKDAGQSWVFKFWIGFNKSYFEMFTRVKAVKMKTVTEPLKELVINSDNLKEFPVMDQNLRISQTMLAVL